MSNRPDSWRERRSASGPPVDPERWPGPPGPPPPPTPGGPRHRADHPQVRPDSAAADTEVLVIPATTSARRPVPGRGWRRLAYTATFGLLNLGPSERDRRVAEYEAMIRSRLLGHYKVGVLGKGGVGKTSVAASVGSVFAVLRQRDRVVAVDADTAFGRLGSRVDPTARGTFFDVTAAQDPGSFEAIRPRLGANRAGLLVLAGDSGMSSRRLLDPAIYREAMARLQRHFAIAVIDCGSAMDAPVTREAMRDLDALIVVSSPWADGASTAAQTMEWLAANGRAGLLQRTVVVLNDSDGHAEKKRRSALAQYFADRGQPVVEVPFDPHLRTGGVIDVTGPMSAATRDRFLEVAATVAANFAAGARRP